MDFMINQIRKQKQGNGFHDRRDLCKQKLQRTAGWAVWSGGGGGGGIATKRKLGFYSTTGFGEYPVFFPPFILNYDKVMNINKV